MTDQERMTRAESAVYHADLEERRTRKQWEAAATHKREAKLALAALVRKQEDKEWWIAGGHDHAPSSIAKSSTDPKTVAFDPNSREALLPPGLRPQVDAKHAEGLQ